LSPGDRGRRRSIAPDQFPATRLLAAPPGRSRRRADAACSGCSSRRPA
jgi:hypothetical protein